MKAFSSKYGLLYPLLILWAVCLLCACKGKGDAADDEGDANVKTITPVTVTTVDESPMSDYIDLNATASFLQKNYVKANANGYIQKVLIEPGHFVSQGQLLFTLKTKEAQSIGNTINVLDTTFKFTGINKIKASKSGYITQLNHQAGDYVQDGEQLGVINDYASFAFLMQLPYEYRDKVRLNQDVQLTLPDGEKLTARVTSMMPTVDTVAQTQGIVLKVNSSHPIPENIIAKARIVKQAKSNTVSLPKAAVLSNETQTEFWVMKMISGNTAVKVPVTKGIETSDRIEITSPKLSPQDKILLTGNYGLPDTAKVKITAQ